MEIIFTLEHRGVTQRVYTHKNQYYSLMTLISDQLGIAGFGICCGMGSCGTCMVAIREAGRNNWMYTLACDVCVDVNLSNAAVRVPDVIF